MTDDEPAVRVRVLRVATEVIEQATGSTPSSLNALEGVLCELSSMDLVALVVAIEDEFAVELPIDGLVREELTTLAALESLITRAGSAGGHA